MCKIITERYKIFQYLFRKNKILYSKMKIPKISFKANN